MSRMPVDKEEAKMSNGRLYWYYFRAHARSFLLVLAVLIAGSYSDGQLPRVYRQMTSSIQTGNVEKTFDYSLQLLLYSIASSACYLFGSYLTNTSGEAVSSHLRLDLFSALQQMPFWFFAHGKSGHFISLFNHQLHGAHNGITRTVPRIVTNILTIIMATIRFAKSDWKLTLGFMIFVPVFAVITEMLQSRLKSSHRQAHNYRSNLNSTLTSRLSASAILAQKNFNLVDSTKQAFTADSKQIQQAQEKISWFQDIYSRISYLLVSLGSSTILVMSTLFMRVQRGEDGAPLIDPAEIVALTTTISQLQGPLIALGTIRIELSNTFSCFESIFQHLRDADRYKRSLEALNDTRPKLKLSVWPGDIQVEDVSFTYPTIDIFSQSADGKPEDSINTTQIDTSSPPVSIDQSQRRHAVFEHLNVNIRQGSKVAIIGPNGSGKTTLAYLLAGLHTPTAGTIRASRHSYNTIDEASFRNLVGILDQEPWFENASILQNMKLASPTASMAEIEEACTVANILDLIRSLPAGFETAIGENAMKLSSGQKQRLALARLVLKKPSFIILDEFNSHLDLRTEQEVFNVLLHHFAEATVVLITHRFSILRKVDEILHIVNGKLLEQGSHQQLLDADGPYAKLYREYIELV